MMKDTDDGIREETKQTDDEGHDNGRRFKGTETHSKQMMGGDYIANRLSGWRDNYLLIILGHGLM